MTSMDDFLKNNCNSSGSINWFNYFFNEPLPRKRFKPYNHSIRRRQSFCFKVNPNCDNCIFDDDDLQVIEDNLNFVTIWQQYDQ
jgi:hypothetical protein